MPQQSLPASATSFPTISEPTPLAPPVESLTSIPLQGTEAAFDFSIWGLVLHADFAVKIVMLLLVGISFWSWAIIFSKYLRLKYLNRQASLFEDMFWSGGALDDLYDRVGTKPQTPLENIFSAAMREWRRSLSRGVDKTQEFKATLQERIERIMHVSVSREMEDLENQMGVLASTGSVSPFIGLFGTVWGIMVSFQAIAASNNTNLAVVAPGIAEALFTTALGLIAAIPAVVAYNKLSNDINRYGSRLDSFSQEFGAIISRQLEENA